MHRADLVRDNVLWELITEQAQERGRLPHGFSRRPSPTAVAHYGTAPPGQLMCVRACLCACVCACVCARVYGCTCMCVCMCVGAHACVHVCACMCVHMCACAAGTCTPVMRGHAHHAAVLRLTTQLVHSPRRGAQPQRVWESPGHRTPDHGPFSFPEQLTEPGQVA